MAFRITVGMLTGGTAKTTTAGNLGLVAAARYGSPEAVLLVDTDKQGQIVAWQQAAHQAGGSFPLTLSWLNSRLAKELDRQEAARGDSLGLIVTDTSNNDFRLIQDAFAAADVVVAPVQPTAMDLDRVAATIEAVEAAQAMNRTMRWGVLISRYDARAKDAKDAREALIEAGLPVLETQIPARKSIGHSFGKSVTPEPDLYGRLLDELLRGGWMNARLDEEEETS